jgi:hypothetical protein
MTDNRVLSQRSKRQLINHVLRLPKCDKDSDLGWHTIAVILSLERFCVDNARTGPRIVTGLIAGLLGYAFILAPTLIATAPSDVSVPESISTAALAAALVTPAILLGATVGAGIRGYRTTDPYRRPR